ncbi:MAG TPA: D-alanyl-D-alanine carboxypeptidase family protein [Spongiibacteraceae bacterium]|nr:D-alanyl-D-alanine carboxypeptidase family protein [Spongiibacteraceae bacterium]
MKKYAMLFAALMFAIGPEAVLAQPSSQQQLPILNPVPVTVPSPPAIAAKAYIMIDADSGRVLAEDNADTRLAPASLTKLMTSYVLSYELEQGHVHNDDLVTISKSAWTQNPEFKDSSLMFIRVGTQVTLHDLHQGIVVSSGNDAATAVAEYLAGSESAFADVMNQHAQRLGMTNTHYVNPHGLPDPDHYTTARDLAKLSQAIIKFPREYALYKEQEFTYNNIRQFNRNGLLKRDPTVDGLKTGHTQEAGYCLVSSALRNGMRLITVVLGADSINMREQETEKLLSYGFRYFETSKVYQAGAEVAQPRVWGGANDSVKLVVANDVALTYPRGKREQIKAVMNVDKYLHAPIAAKQKVGEMVVTLGDETLYRAPLVALEAVDNGGFFHRLWDAVVLFFTKLLS